MSNKIKIKHTRRERIAEVIGKIRQVKSCATYLDIEWYGRNHDIFRKIDEDLEASEIDTGKKRKEKERKTNYGYLKNVLPLWKCD